MKKINAGLLVIILLLIATIGTEAQEIGLTTTFRLMTAKSWNRATDTYNFSRPFLTEKQPLLQYGGSIGVYYLSHPENRLAFGPSLTFSFFRSAADNPGLKVGINACLLDIGWRLQLRPGDQERNPLGIAFTPSLKGVMLSRRVNGNIAVIGPTEEDLNVRRWGGGLGLDLQFSYDLSIGNNRLFAPLIGVHYDPLVWTDRSELVFNQASVGDLKSSTSIWGLRAGFLVRRLK